MRFSTAIVAGSFAVLASAASETSAAQPASTSAVDKCIAKCPVADVNCKAHCIAVPSPDDSQANANTECARKCPQGSGSPEDTKKFGDCLQKCSNDHYFQTSVGTPESTGTPNSGNNGGSGGNGNSGSGGSGGSGANSSAGSGGNGGDSSNTSAGGSGGAGATGTGATGTGAAKPTGTSGGSSDNASKTGSDAKATESGKSGDKNGAAGLVASSAALFGAVAAFFAL